MIQVSRAEVCVIACAELFRDAGEIMVSPMTTIVSIGARLARLTFSPDIVLTDGEARLIADTPAIGAPAAIEGWMPFGRVFETLAWGRRHVVMGANQIDQHGNQNLSAFGPLQHPTRQMFGVRGAPGNTINHATSYWVGNHSKRVFCEKVDIASGIGWDKVDPTNPAYRYVNVNRVVSNLGVFDFNGPDHTMRAISLHPGVQPDDVRNNTSFAVHGLDDAGVSRLPTGEELDLIRQIDPRSLRDKEAPGSLRDKEVPGSLRDKEVRGSLRDKEAPGSLRDKEVPGSLRDKEAQA
jgi:acyl CoA:acetate/3-ketoacid CoA transferase beta subunit